MLKSSNSFFSAHYNLFVAPSVALLAFSGYHVELFLYNLGDWSVSFDRLLFSTKYLVLTSLLNFTTITSDFLKEDLLFCGQKFGPKHNKEVKLKTDESLCFLDKSWNAMLLRSSNHDASIFSWRQLSYYLLLFYLCLGQSQILLRRNNSS